MKIKLVFAFLLSIISLNLYAQEGADMDSKVVIKTIDVVVVYCMSTDSAIASAIEHGIPIVYPTLAINGVVISDENEIDIIRNCFHSSVDGQKLGPYRVRQIKRYSSLEAERKGFHNVSKYGIVRILLKRNEIFDIQSLENWLQDMIEKNPNYLKETMHYSNR